MIPDFCEVKPVRQMIETGFAVFQTGMEPVIIGIIAQKMIPDFRAGKEPGIIR